MIIYKTLLPNRISPYVGAQWPEPGDWFRADDRPLERCWNGLHLVTRDALVDWLAPEVWTVEARDFKVNTDGVVVARSARLLERVAGWNLQIARRLAVDVAGPVVDRIIERDEAIGALASLALRQADELASLGDRRAPLLERSLIQSCEKLERRTRVVFAGDGGIQAAAIGALIHVPITATDWASMDRRDAARSWSFVWRASTHARIDCLDRLAERARQTARLFELLGE